jgi:hypothetical protein
MTFVAESGCILVGSRTTSSHLDRCFRPQTIFPFSVSIIFDLIRLHNLMATPAPFSCEDPAERKTNPYLREGSPPGGPAKADYSRGTRPFLRPPQAVRPKAPRLAVRFCLRPKTHKTPLPAGIWDEIFKISAPGNDGRRSHRRSAPLKLEALRQPNQ